MLRKRISAALAAVMTLASFGTASAVYNADVMPVQTETQDELSVAAAESRPQTSKFSYSLDGEELTVSLNGQTIKNNTDEDINVFFAVYEDDILCKTKLYTISADYPEVNLRDWKTTYSGGKDALKVKAFIWTADGKCTPLDKASELNDISGTIYKVYGRVLATSRGTSLRRGEVKFNIEKSDDFEGMKIDKSLNNILVECFQVGNTNAEDMLFIYSEAFIAKAPDGTFTIASIESCDPSQTVTFAAKDLADDDKNIGTNYVDRVKNPKLPVYKNGSSSSTTKYDLSYDYAYYSNAVMYVNGVDIGIATDSKIDSYILRNTTGSVTLIDETEVGSTSTDGKYEYIMVDYYVDAVVDYVSATSASARIYFKNSDGAGTKMEWDPEDSDIDLKFKKDGKEIAYTDLAEFDVLSIQYDMVNDNLTDFDYANVLVSSNVAEGSVTSTDSADQTITIGGTEYHLNENMTNVNYYELGTKYKVYIDAFGYVAFFDVGSSEKDYGVIVSMQKSDGDDYPTISLVTADGEIVSYECKDETEANRFYNYAVAGNVNGSASWQPFTKDTIASRINAGATVCTYRITRGRIEFDKAFYGNGGADLEYKASSSKVGSYSIDTYTRIIDMDWYMNKGKDKVSTLSMSDFEDEATYTAYFFDKNSDSVYRFGIVFEGISVIRPETQIAVVKGINGRKDAENGDACNSYTVYRAGEETELLIEDGAVYTSAGSNANITEGSVIAYLVGLDGYAETDDVYVLYTPESTYNDHLASILANEDFSGSRLDWVNQVTAGKNKGRYEIAYKGKTSTSKDVFAYVGVVHGKTASGFELFTEKTDGISSIFYTTSFAIGADTNVYTFDYAAGTLTAVDSPAQYNTLFNSAYINDGIAVDWDRLDADPQLAFVKEVDGEATDVIFFVPPDYYEGEEPVDEPVDDPEEEGVHYGIITAMYRESGKDCPIVRFVTMDGELEAYECEADEEALKFYNYAVYGDAEESNPFGGFSKSTIRNNILSGLTVCRYKISGDKVRFESGISVNGGEYLEYKASSCRLGSYSVKAGATKMIDMDAYINNDTDKINTVAVSELEDEAVYTAYVFGKSNAGYYRYAVFFDGLYSVRPETQIAVVKKVNGQKDTENGDTCSSYTVYRANQEVELLVEQGTVRRSDNTAAYIGEGSVIAYMVGSDGYAETDNVYVLYTPASTYYGNLRNMLYNGDFCGSQLDWVKQVTSGKNEGKYEIAYRGMTSSYKDVFAYVGVVYRKQNNVLELFTKQSGNISSINAVADLSLGSATGTYTFDYCQRADKGVRLEVGTANQSNSTYNPIFINDKNDVDWTRDDIEPMTAFVKEVDGEVTDVVLFMPE